MRHSDPDARDLPLVDPSDNSLLMFLNELEHPADRLVDGEHEAEIIPFPSRRPAD